MTYQMAQTPRCDVGQYVLFVIELKGVQTTHSFQKSITRLTTSTYSQSVIDLC